jgi:hypothetical protein
MRVAAPARADVTYDMTTVRFLERQFEASFGISASDA